MTPTFDQIVEWLKSLDEGQIPPPQAQFPKSVQFPGPATVQYAAKAPEGPRQPAWAPAAEPVAQPAPDGKPEQAAASSIQTDGDSIRSLLANLTGDRLIQGIVLSEVLGRPAALRRAGRSGLRK